MKRSQRYVAHGFTLVELVIVIVVIAILAAITIVSYSGITARARDSVRLDDSQKIVDALSLYAHSHGNLVGIGSGCGRYGDGAGWFNAGSAIDPSPPNSDYPRAVVDCLVDNNLISIDVVDPSGSYGFSSTAPDGKYSYMKYNCNDTATVAYVFIKLEKQAPADRMATSGVCEGYSNPATTQAISAYDGYKMNYYLKVSI
ncbi:MAG: prepilin-type N-terminal cleavage/methylation domain-containing protein [Candidatus Saccharimonadaceae bacterium]